VSEEKVKAAGNDAFPRHDIVSRTTEEWTDLPVEFALWKYSREEDKGFLESIATAISEETSGDDLVESYVNRHGELVERYRLHLSLRLMSRRCAGTAAWDVILQILGITANVMGVTGGTFAAAKFVAMARRKAKEKASAHGYDHDFGVSTPAAAALLAANWLMENDPETAIKLIASGNTYLHATDHGPYFVVSIRSPGQDELFIVAGTGGGVTRIPLPPKEVEG